MRRYIFDMNGERYESPDVRRLVTSVVYRWYGVSWGCTSRGGWMVTLPRNGE